MPLDTLMPDSEIYATIVALVLIVCWGRMRRDPASPGPDSEELSGVRPGESPTEAPVVSGGTHLDLFASAFSAHGVPETADLPLGQHPPGSSGGRETGAGRAHGLDPCTIQQLEQAPACDRASDLLSDINPTASDKPRRVDVRSTVAGAPTVIYSWRRPGEAKRLIECGWELEKIDDEYGGWLVRKEERWP